MRSPRSVDRAADGHALANLENRNGFFARVMMAFLARDLPSSCAAVSAA